MRCVKVNIISHRRVSVRVDNIHWICGRYSVSNKISQINEIKLTGDAMIVYSHAREMGVDVATVFPPLNHVSDLLPASCEVTVELGADRVVGEVRAVIVVIDACVHLLSSVRPAMEH